METQYLFILTKFSHSFKVTDISHSVKYIFEKFSRRYVVMSLTRNAFSKKPSLIADKHYITVTSDKEEYRYHINQLEDFLSFFSNYRVTLNNILIIDKELFEPFITGIKIKPSWVLRDHQPPMLEYLISKSNNNKMLSVGTGRGKSSVSLCATSEIGYRTTLLIKPAYMDKWVVDIQKTLDININQIVTIQGTNELKNYINLALLNELPYLYSVISLNTYRAFLNHYELDRRNTKEVYGCLPENFFELTKTGTLILDEVHQEFYSIYKLFTFTHIPLVISLSATLIDNNSFIQKVYEMVYPNNNRFIEENKNKYIKAYGVGYAFKDIKKIQTADYGSRFYSHSAFEKSIMRNTEKKIAYFNFINYVIKLGYLEGYKKGDKMSIFLKSIAMCVELTRYLKTKHYSLDIRKYTEEDPYENVIDSDIRVTTIESSGTAIDIPNLTCVLLTVNVDSMKANIQTLGRLREIPGRDVKFYYIYCYQLIKHRDYHKRRMQTLLPHAKMVNELTYPYRL